MSRFGKVLVAIGLIVCALALFYSRIALAAPAKVGDTLLVVSNEWVAIRNPGGLNVGQKVWKEESSCRLAPRATLQVIAVSGDKFTLVEVSNSPVDPTATFNCPDGVIALLSKERWDSMHRNYEIERSKIEQENLERDTARELLKGLKK